MNIKKGDKITFTLKDGQTFCYIVETNFLSNPKSFNNEIFRALGIEDQYEYCRKFWPAGMGDWPTYTNPNDIEPLLYAWMDKGIKISVNSYDFYKDLLKQEAKVTIDQFYYHVEGNFLRYEDGDSNNIALKSIYGKNYIKICEMCYGYEPCWYRGDSWPETKRGDYDALLKLLYYTKRTRGVEITIEGFSLSTNMIITSEPDFLVSKIVEAAEKSIRDEEAGECIEDSASSKWVETVIDEGRLYAVTDEKSSYKTDPSEKEITLTLTKLKIKF